MLCFGIKFFGWKKKDATLGRCAMMAIGQVWVERNRRVFDVVKGLRGGSFM